MRCLRSSFFRAISAVLSSLVMLGDGDVFVLASELSSLGGGGDERGVERRVGGVSRVLRWDAILRDDGEASCTIFNPTARMGFGSTTTGAELSNAPQSS